MYNKRTQGFDTAWLNTAQGDSLAEIKDYLYGDLAHNNYIHVYGLRLVLVLRTPGILFQNHTHAQGKYKALHMLGRSSREIQCFVFIYLFWRGGTWRESSRERVGPSL